jgi:hypothetical protein
MPAQVTPPGPLEQQYFSHWGSGSPAGARGPAADFDGDGAPNILEIALGSAPRHPGSLPAVTAGRISGERLTLTFPRHALPELEYCVEFSSDLHPGNWTPGFLSAGAANTTGPVTATDALDPAPGRRFARLKVTLP